YAYTRAGDFRLDAEGYLVNADGLRVLGWQAAGGVLPARDALNLGPIRVPVDLSVPAQASTRVTWTSNLDATAPTSAALTQAVDVYDSLGNPHTLVFTFTRTGTNQWSWSAADAANPSSSLATGTLTFSNAGVLTAGSPATVNFAPAGAAPMTLTVDFSALTQYAGPSTVEATADGYPAGQLTSFAFDPSGTITGTFSNGMTQPIAQVALASFANPAGLLRDGNLYWASNNSGVARIGEAGTGGRGALTPGALEMSNVDLSREFVDMIVTQRGFQANSRVITTSDEMLQELVNLKR
ncbi:MAG TPA: flagellar hook protein FlgE, partial [Thermaerobacter sp.]